MNNKTIYDYPCEKCPYGQNSDTCTERYHIPNTAVTSKGCNIWTIWFYQQWEAIRDNAKRIFAKNRKGV